MYQELRSGSPTRVGDVGNIYNSENILNTGNIYSSIKNNDDTERPPPLKNKWHFLCFCYTAIIVLLSIIYLVNVWDVYLEDHYSLHIPTNILIISIILFYGGYLWESLFLSDTISKLWSAGGKGSLQAFIREVEAAAPTVIIEVRGFHMEEVLLKESDISGRTRDHLPLRETTKKVLRESYKESRYFKYKRWCDEGEMKTVSRSSQHLTYLYTLTILTSLHFIDIDTHTDLYSQLQSLERAYADKDKFQDTSVCVCVCVL
eukprot:GHVR01171134.1.p1 GENE.GHVR01171134.1~~GHVR01171134.1.p1  ORF type:complete len:260 (-),score=43.46 GHVR01171134.1:124-903(-)